MSEPSAWQFGWAALGSLGTCIASLVALWIAHIPRGERLRREEARQQAFGFLVATELRSILIGAKILTKIEQNVHRFDDEQRFLMIKSQFNHSLLLEAFMSFTDLSESAAAQTGKVIAAVRHCQEFLDQLRNPHGKRGITDEQAEKSMRVLGENAFKETLALMNLLGIAGNIANVLHQADVELSAKKEG